MLSPANKVSGNLIALDERVNKEKSVPCKPPIDFKMNGAEELFSRYIVSDLLWQGDRVPKLI